jgi:NitT/TauT family transport system substrate-binding protein
MSSATSKCRIFFSLVAFILLFGCGKKAAIPEGSEGASFQLSLQPDWYAQPEHGGFYMALAKGLYAEADLDVEILGAAPNLPFLQRVAKGEATVGFSRLDLIAQAVERGLPLVVIGEYSAHAPSGIMVPADSEIETFADLDGKRVMAAVYAPYIDFIQSHFEIEMDLVPHNWGTAQFRAGEVEAQQCYITSEPYYLEREGFPVRSLLVADAGYDPPHVLYAGRAVWESNKEALMRFYLASMEGWQRYLSEDPSAAHALIAEKNPQMDGDFMNWSHAILRDEGLISGRTPEIRATWGQLGEAEVVNMVHIMQAADELITMDPHDHRWIDYSFAWEPSE